MQRYRQRISGPLLDRIDLRVEVNAPSVDELALAPGTAGVANGASGEELRAQVAAARERIAARQGRQTNARLAADELDRLAPLASEGRRLIEAAARARSLSARAVQSVRRVARTIADLEACEAVSAAHLAEAIALRAPV